VGRFVSKVFSNKVQRKEKKGEFYQSESDSDDTDAWKIVIVFQPKIFRKC
jgi:hypothetical protein